MIVNFINEEPETPLEEISDPKLIVKHSEVSVETLTEIAGNTTNLQILGDIVRHPTTPDELTDSILQKYPVLITSYLGNRQLNKEFILTLLKQNRIPVPVLHQILPLDLENPEVDEEIYAHLLPHVERNPWLAAKLITDHLAPMHVKDTADAITSFTYREHRNNRGNF